MSIGKILIKIMCALFQYHKQTQLEAMASEKAAAEFQLEKEARRLQEAQVFTPHLFVYLACKRSLQLCKHFHICCVGRSRKK